MCLVVGSGGAEEDMMDFIPSGTPGEARVLLGEMEIFAGYCQSSVQAWGKLSRDMECVGSDAGARTVTYLSRVAGCQKWWQCS